MSLFPRASSLVDLLDPDEQRPSKEADGNGDVTSGRSLKTQMLKDVFWAFGVASEAAEAGQVCPGGAGQGHLGIRKIQETCQYESRASKQLTPDCYFKKSPWHL